MLRFVVLLHEMPAGASRPTHYDLMLEQDGALWTWACEQLPAAGKAVPARRLTDHRLAYLEYEGPVSGDRGSVTRVASGTYELLSVADGEIRARLAGELLRGELVLRKEAEDRWRVSMEENGAPAATG